MYRIGFVVLILSIVYLVQRFWFLRAWRLIDGVTRPGVRHALQGLWILALVLLVTATVAGHFIPRHGIGYWVIAGSRIWLFASLAGCIALLSVEMLDWASRHALTVLVAARREEFDPARRAFFRLAGYAAAGLPFLVAGYGFNRERLRYTLEKMEVPIPGLPKGLDGLRIVQLSDIHIGTFMPAEEIRRAVDIANELNPDLAVLTGDFITGEDDPLETCIAELSRLQARLGVWGCNGNHEIYADAEDAAQQLFERYGMRMLRQQNAVVGHNGERFNLIGVDYQRERDRSGRHLPMLAGVESLTRGDMPNILLSHNPNSFVRAAEMGIDLSLAGHTHGGQVRVEIVDHEITPARFITEFTAGLYRRPVGDGANRGRSAFLYVNRGLGTIGMPVRFGVPPEITLLTLRAA